MTMKTYMSTSVNSQVLVNDNDPDVFKVPMDRFHCVTVHSASVSCQSPAEFQDKLKKSLEVWRREGVRGVWVHVNIEHSELIPQCTQLGFVFHHAKESYVLLKFWLPEDEEDNLPPFATQYLGCGGFVLNENNEILVVKEKYHGDPHWKFPGGHTEPGEEIAEAAEREVFEETGIRAKFEAIICFRHQHDYKFGCSDFYFVSLMRPVNQDINFGANEIQECVWMPLEEFLHHPQVSEFNRYIAECYVDHLRSGNIAFSPRPVSSFHSSEVKNLVYSVAPVPARAIDKGLVPVRAPSRIHNLLTRSDSENSDMNVTDSDPS